LEEGMDNLVAVLVAVDVERAASRLGNIDDIDDERVWRKI
jgi:hypothetical protein